MCFQTLPNGVASPGGKPPIFNRSVSETRAAAAEQPCDLFAHTPRATKPVGQEASPADASSLGSSDLAKRFLGSLTPQLKPLSSQQEISRQQELLKIGIQVLERQQQKRRSSKLEVITY